MLEWLKDIFRRKTVNSPNLDTGEHEDQTKFIWCLVGNVIDEHSGEAGHEMKRGTKHFSPNTKVYCFPIQWGDGYKNIKVIGRHRKTSRNVCIVIPSKSISNWRIRKIYHPHIISIMQSQNGWTNSETDKEKILQMLS